VVVMILLNGVIAIRVNSIITYKLLVYTYYYYLFIYLFIYYTIINIFIGLDSWQSDSGDIREKEHLPIKQVRFGDTGSTLDEKEGRFKVGPLMCEGDGKFLFYF